MGQHIAIEAKGALQMVACNFCGSRHHTPMFEKKGYRLVRCRECDLAYIANPSGADDLAAIYTTGASYHEDLLDEASEQTARQRGVARQHMAMLRRFVPDVGGLTVLDIGCSAGFFLDEARTAGMQTAGAELSPETAAFARNHFGLDVHRGDWRDAAYAGASFDVVTLFDVIEHLPDPLAELRAIRRLLKPGGLLLQSTPDIDGLFPRASYLAAKLLDYWPHPEPPHHLFQFSARTLSAMADKAGYRVTGQRHTSIDLAYSFGGPATWKASPKMLAYAFVFAPVVMLGHVLGKGDWLYLAATRD